VSIFAGLQLRFRRLLHRWEACRSQDTDFLRQNLQFQASRLRPLVFNQSFERSDWNLLSQQTAFFLEGNMSVGRICVREVDTARSEESVAVAAQRMHQRAVGTLVVVNDASQVVGIVTDRDLVSRLLAKGLNAQGTAVRDVMTIAPKTVFEGTPIETALLTMRVGRFRRLPVVGRTNELLGLVTLDDVLMHLAEEFTQIGRLLIRETPQAVVENNNISHVSRFQNVERIGVGD
jgi:CBS domain-containing protein